ncbi:uncharacterized protein LOC129912332 [Episyrphus balteatus]|uniref:uncharacterized protein LOC129912332 n=1 Tax=Episyrphus balteatus TaxID=286459 RepID=UPI00248552B8|nr:uncharacterized protein LOC129912332 [Episyrphus balteatus]
MSRIAVICANLKKYIKELHSICNDISSLLSYLKFVLLIQTKTTKMFKLFVAISTLCALAAARPGYLHGAPLHAPLLSYAPVVHPAPIIKVLPPAISHSSSTIVHGHPTIIHAPVIPAVKTIIAPAYHPAPLLSPYHGLHLGPHYH